MGCAVTRSPDGTVVNRPPATRPWVIWMFVGAIVLYALNGIWYFCNEATLPHRAFCSLAKQAANPATITMLREWRQATCKVSTSQEVRRISRDQWFPIGKSLDPYVVVLDDHQQILGLYWHNKFGSWGLFVCGDQYDLSIAIGAQYIRELREVESGVYVWWAKGEGSAAYENIVPARHARPPPSVSRPGG